MHGNAYPNAHHHHHYHYRHVKSKTTACNSFAALESSTTSLSLITALPTDWLEDLHRWSSIFLCFVIRSCFAPAAQNTVEAKVATPHDASQPYATCSRPGSLTQNTYPQWLRIPATGDNKFPRLAIRRLVRLQVDRRGRALISAFI